MTKLDQLINSLKHSESKVISQFNGIVCSVERSGDGKTLRFVRTSGNTTEVFKTCNF